ncbi:hypothetical protein FKM82_017892 [Ascaphus truei]
MHLRNKNKQETCKLNGDKLGESLMEKDLGVLVHSNSAQSHAVTAKANKILSYNKWAMDGREVHAQSLSLISESYRYKYTQTDMPHICRSLLCQLLLAL